MNYLLITIVFLVLLIVGAVAFFLLRKRGRRFYKAKGPYLLSGGERAFFDALQQVIAPDMYVCPKIRIADIIDMAIPKTDPQFWPRFNQISQKHVDFLLCNKNTFAPLLVVELDGRSHADPKRSARDAMVDGVFSQAGIPMLHIPVSSFYPYKELREQIARAVQPAAQNVGEKMEK